MNYIDKHKRNSLINNKGASNLHIVTNDEWIKKGYTKKLFLTRKVSNEKQPETSPCIVVFQRNDSIKQILKRE